MFYSLFIHQDKGIIILILGDKPIKLLFRTKSLCNSSSYDEYENDRVTTLQFVYEFLFPDSFSQEGSKQFLLTDMLPPPKEKFSEASRL